jgi:glutamine synthetase
MTKYKLEYIWLDGKKPIPELRGKTQLKSFEKPPTLEDLPLWGFDGSSTMQAEGSKSDCILKPVASIPMPAARTPISFSAKSCTPTAPRTPPTMRATIENDPDLWVGFEQEYFLYKDGRPLGFPKRRPPETPQGPYYCGVGYKYMGSIWPAPSSKSTSSSASPPASTTKASTPKSPRASGSSRSSPKAPPRPPTMSGSLAT